MKRQNSAQGITRFNQLDRFNTGAGYNDEKVQIPAIPLRPKAQRVVKTAIVRIDGTFVHSMTERINPSKPLDILRGIRYADRILKKDIES